MIRPTRGFTGRGKGQRDPRLPPGQYDTGRDWPVLTAEATPRLDTATWSFTRRGLVETPTTWTWDEIHALPPATYRRRHPLRHDLVEARHDLHRRLGGHAAGGRRARCRAPPTSWPSPTPGTRPTSRSADVTGGQAWVAWEVDGEPLRANTAARPGCSSPICTSGRAPNGSPASVCSTTTSRVSGSRTATTTEATRGSSSATKVTDRCPTTGGPVAVADGHGRRRQRRDAAGQDVPACAWPNRRHHLAGQHYVVRLTAPDGYTAVAVLLGRVGARRRPPRSRSPSSGSTDGEVSTFLHDEVVTGDELEVRGPIGGWFVWRGDTPALLDRRRLRGGAADGHAPPGPPTGQVRTWSGWSCRSAAPRTCTTPTSCPARRRPSSTPARRHPPTPVRPAVSATTMSPVSLGEQTYICGSSPFADAVTDLVMKTGVPADRIRIERFGPSG